MLWATQCVCVCVLNFMFDESQNIMVSSLWVEKFAFRPTVLYVRMQPLYHRLTVCSVVGPTHQCVMIG